MQQQKLFSCLHQSGLKLPGATVGWPTVEPMAWSSPWLLVFMLASSSHAFKICNLFMNKGKRSGKEVRIKRLNDNHWHQMTILKRLHKKSNLSLMYGACQYLVLDKFGQRKHQNVQKRFLKAWEQTVRSPRFCSRGALMLSHVTYPLIKKLLTCWVVNHLLSL